MSTFSSAPIVIDGKGHLLGRLASVLAKQVCISILSPSLENGARGRRRKRKTEGNGGKDCGGETERS